MQAAQLAESARLGVKRLGIRYPNQPAGASITISLGIASVVGDLFPSAEALVGAASERAEGRQPHLIDPDQLLAVQMAPRDPAEEAGIALR